VGDIPAQLSQYEVSAMLKRITLIGALAMFIFAGCQSSKSDTPNATPAQPVVKYPEYVRTSAAKKKVGKVVIKDGAKEVTVEGSENEASSDTAPLSEVVADVKAMNDEDAKARNAVVSRVLDAHYAPPAPTTKPAVKLPKLPAGVKAVPGTKPDDREVKDTRGNTWVIEEVGSKLRWKLK